MNMESEPSELKWGTPEWSVPEMSFTHGLVDGIHIVKVDRPGGEVWVPADDEEREKFRRRFGDDAKHLRLR